MEFFFMPFLKASREVMKDLNAGGECVTWCTISTWCEQTYGSRPYYWQWGANTEKHLKDGVPPWSTYSLVRYYKDWREIQF
jgi:hypothetical protein